MNLGPPALLGSAVALAGCQLPAGTIFNTSQQHHLGITTTDARQRVVIAHNPNIHSRPGLITPIQVVCTEPSPDVALAVANSFGAGLSILTRGSGSLSAEQSQAVLQLAERTATLQILREQMFRACEAYSNGAITGTTYSLMLSKLYHTIATLSLGDTAGGNFGRALAGAGVAASAEANASMAGFANAINDAKEAALNLAVADEKVKIAQTKVNDQEKLYNGATTDEAKATEKAKLDAANADLAKGTGERDAMRELLKGRLDTATKAGAQVSSLTSGGGLQRAPSESVARVLSDMLAGFLNSDNNQSVVQACLVELGMRPDNSLQDVLIMDRTIEKLFELKPETADDVLNRHENALARNASLTRRTGLYRHCEANLADYVQKARESDTRVKLATLEFDRRRLDVRELELRATAIQKAAEAVAACSKIENKPLHDQCINMVTSFNGGEQSPAERLKHFESARAERPESLPIEPWLELTSSKARFEQLLNKVEAFKPAAGTTPTQKQHAENLQRQKDKHLEGGKSLQRAANQVLSDWTQERVLSLQNRRYPLLVAFDAAKTPIELAKGQAALATHSAETKALAQLLDATRRELDQSRSGMEAFLLQARADAPKK